MPGLRITGALQLSAALAAHPGLGEALEGFQEHRASLEGTPVLTDTSVEAIKSEDQMAREQAEGEPAPRSPGGALGKLGKKLAKKEEALEKRSLVFRSETELLEVWTEVPAEEVAIPAGFKEK